MNKAESERQFRVLDQMLSMHAELRDKFRRRSLLLNLSLLLTSVLLCAFVFADKSIFLYFGLETKIVNILLGTVSVLCFAFSLVEYRVDWQGKSAVHADSVRKLASLKADYNENFSIYGAENEEENKLLSKKYNDVMGGIVEIPEACFANLKAKHLRKILLSKRISECPASPVILLRTQLLLSGIFSSFGCKPRGEKRKKHDNLL